MTYGSTLPRHSVLKYCASSDTRSADSFGDVLLFRALTYYLLRFVAGWDLGRLVKTGVGAFRAVAAVSLCRRVFVYMIYWGVCAIFLSTGPPFLIDPSH